MLTGEAVAALGYPSPPGLDAVVVRFNNGRPAHYPLAECVNNVIDDQELYLATGLFLPNTISREGGRKEENLARILSFPFDFDLSDYTGLSAHDLWAMPQSAIDTMIAKLRGDVEEVFRLIGLPIHSLVYTGYGVAAHVRVPPHKKETVVELRSLHKAIVARINAVARFKFADPQVSDAGTRIMRLPGTVNKKGATPRPTRMLYTVDGVVDETQLRLAANQTIAPLERMVPKTGKPVDDATERAVIEAIRPHWTLGQKHAMGLALSGMLAKAGFPEEQTLRIIETLAANDEKLWDRQKAVQRTYDRLRSGMDLQGFFALREMLPPDLLAWLEHTTAKVRDATAPILLIGPDRVVKPVVPLLTAPPEAAFFGWIGEYRDLMEPTTEAPDSFHLGTALTLVGAMVGRHIHVRYAGDTLYPNLYTVLIGASGSSRKDTAIKRGLALPQLQKSLTSFIKPPFNISRDVSSAEGLVGILKEQPNTLLYLTELSTLMENAHRKGTKTILDRLIEAWDTPHKIENLNKNSPQTADNPCLSIIAATQPGRLAAQMTDEDIFSGFANRWIYIPGEGKAARPTPPAVDEAAAWRLYLDLKHVIDSYGEGHRLDIAPDVKSYWDDWYVTQHNDRSLSEEEAAMRVRHAVLIHKIALVYAITEQASVISLRHIEPAVALIEWMWSTVRLMLREWGVGPLGQIERRIEAALKKHGPISRRDLTRLCSSKRWLGRDITITIDAMLKSGELVMPSPGVIAFSEGP